MDPTGQDDCLLMGVILDVRCQPLTEVLERWVGLDQSVHIVLVEAFDLFFKRSIQEPLDLAFAVLALFEQLSCFLILLPELLLDDWRQFVLNLDLLVVLLVRVYV